MSDALAEGCKSGHTFSPDPAPSARSLSCRAQRMLYKAIDQLKVVEKLSGKQYYVRELS